ncbi:MAG: lysophospholipid acyltransferase family protein [Paracoccaceae bacterium]
MSNWDPESRPDEVAISAVGWVIATLRGLALLLLTYGGLFLLLLVRLVEAPLFGSRRPLTPYITTLVSRSALLLLGISYTVRGTPMRHMGAVVANHSSWLDIFALNACQQVYFVSKAEVARWPVIGYLARATGTVFIARDPREARVQQALFERRIRQGHKLLFFPEGTSTDGRRVLSFKPTLFAAFFTPGLEHVMHIQPVTVAFHAPRARDPRFYGWWGDMDFFPHLILTLATPLQGAIEVIFHEPVRVDDFASRKDLSAYCEEVVRRGLTPLIQPDLGAGPPTGL